MEYDFSMLGLQAVGGFVEEVGGRKVLVTVYEGKGLTISCLTFLGAERDLPADAAIFFDAGKERKFYTFSQGRINGVLQRVGEKICILVSEMPLQDLVALAQSRVSGTGASRLGIRVRQIDDAPVEDRGVIVGGLTTEYKP
jgi:hypothetical protein